MNTPHYYQSALAAKVAAVNQAHSLILQLAPLIQAAIAPFAGQQIENATGGWRKKLKEALPKLPGYPEQRNINCHLSTGHGYTLTLRINVDTYWKEGNGNDGTQRAEALAYIADMDNKLTLGKLHDLNPGNWRTDYTEAEIVALREELRKAEEAVSKINSKLYNFGKFEPNS
jgi:hypothetical protein